MGSKKNSTRFSIVFSKTDPLHLQTIELLNGQGYRGKAQYIVNAVLHYNSCDKALDTLRLSRIDEKAIEAVVKRLLRDGAVIATDAPSDCTAETPMDEPQAKPAEEISFDDAVEALGEDGFNAVAGALDMFRSK